MIKKHPPILLRILVSCFMWLAISTPVALAAAADIPATDVQLSSLSADQLQQAAEAGDPDAQYALGYLYYYGKNVPQDSQQAMNWIKRAAVQGQDQAVKALAMLNKSATNTQSTTAVSSTSTLQSVKTAPPSTATPDTSVASSQIAISQTQSTTEDSQSITPPRKATTPTSSGAQRLRNASDSAYTIQLLASASKPDLLRYIQMHTLDSQAMYYQTEHNGHDWYVLVYGLYKTRSEAQAALQKLPASVRANQPWIKAMITVKKAIDNG